MSRDVLVLGAGLAGLAAARDLAAGGADVLVLEARDRAGRARRAGSCSTTAACVQMGGEVVGRVPHRLPRAGGRAGAGDRAAATSPSRARCAGTSPRAPGQGDWPPFFTRRRRRRRRADRGRAASQLAATVDPDDPWAHPDAAALDAISFAGWLRAQGATPGGRCACTSSARSRWRAARSSGSRCSAQLRLVAVAGAEEIYGYERWEGMRLARGQRGARRCGMAEELGDRVRLGARVTAIDVGALQRAVTLRDGEELRAEASSARCPSGRCATSPSPACRTRGWRACTASARRSRPRSSRRTRAGLARRGRERARATARGRLARPGRRATTRSRCSSRPSGSRIFLAAPPAAAAPRCSPRWRGCTASARAEPDALLERAWGLDPLTQGYVAQWAPGDLTAVGPLHGTHEPPFYVCGSDHWVAATWRARCGPAARRRPRSSATAAR